MRSETRMGGERRDFPTTCWSSILSCRDAKEEDARQMLEELLAAYWKPIYCCIRFGWRKSTEESKDLVQDFLVHLLRLDLVKQADPARGRFRSFLKSALQNFLLNERRDAGRLKRGGELKIVSLDHVEGIDPVTGDPEQVFDAEWARTVLERGIAILRERLTESRREVYFRVLDLHDLKTPTPSYKDIAEKLDLTESLVRNYLHAARVELRKILRDELRRYALDEEDLKAELRWILK